MALRERGDGPSGADTKKNKNLLKEGDKTSDTPIAPLTAPGRERTGWSLRQKLTTAGVTAAIVGPVVGWATLRPKHNGESTKQDNIPGVVTTANADTSIPTKVTVTTEAPTTTEVPEVFRSPEGQLLQRYGYSPEDAATVMEIAKKVQAKTPDQPILQDIGGADRLRLVNLPFNPAGAQANSDYVAETVASGYTTQLTLGDLGTATFKMVPNNYDVKEAVLVLPVGAPIPPAWAADFAGRNSTYGFTRNGMTVMQIDESLPSAAYSADALEITEGLMRRGTLMLASRDDVSDPSIPDITLRQVAREIDFNWRGIMGGLKETGYRESITQAFINGTDGANGNIIHVSTYSKPLRIPQFDEATYNGLPGPDKSAWRSK